MSGDTFLRAMTDDGGFRAVVVDTTRTVAEAVRVQGARGDEARWLGDLITGAILVRETMAPGLRVQGIVQGPGGVGSMVADSHPDGGARGLVRRGRGSTVAVGGGSVFQMSRTMPDGQMHTGVVEVPAGGSVSVALMAYLQESEQVASMIAVATVFEGDDVVAAGGYLVQLLPELKEAQLAIMTERLADFPPYESLVREGRASPRDIVEELFYLIPFTLLAEGALRFQCRCDAQRLMGALATLSPGDLADMIAEGEDLEIRCDYCAKDYRFPVDQLRALLQ